MGHRKLPDIPDEIVCFANLSGVDGKAYFASMRAFGFYRQLTVGEQVRIKDCGLYTVARVWSREEQIQIRKYSW